MTLHVGPRRRSGGDALVPGQRDRRSRGDRPTGEKSGPAPEPAPELSSGLSHAPAPEPVPAPRRGREPTVALMLREIVLVCSLMVGYSAARLLGGSDVDTAFRHAGDLVRAEQWLHLPREQGLQDLLLRSTTLPQLANLYYQYAHLTVATLALLWLFWAHPLHYVWARRALLTATATALVCYLVVPVAPPRMLGSLGFVDVARQFGQSVYGSPTGDGLTNQYAAMPSLHVGWSVLFAVVGIAAGTRRRRWLWMLHPVVTVLVVVATGNHFWLDALAGSALVAVALAVTGCVAHTDLREPVASSVRPTTAHVT